MDCKSCGCEQINLGTTDGCIQRDGCGSAGLLSHWLVSIVFEEKAHQGGASSMVEYFLPIA